MLETLLARGADFNTRKRGNTWLHEASRVAEVDAVQVLLEHGADEDCVNDDGRTAYDVAGTSPNEDDEQDFDEFVYDGRSWTGPLEHVECIRRMLTCAPADRSKRAWNRRRTLMMLVARHKKHALARAQDRTSSTRQKMVSYVIDHTTASGGSVPAVVRKAPNDGGGGRVAGMEPLRDAVARLANLEEEGIRHTVRFL